MQDVYGKPVACAGNIRINQGKITEINNSCGHYQTTPDQLLLTVQYFHAHGLLSENIKITSYGSGDNGSIVESKLDLSTIINTDIDAILKKYERLPDFNNSLNINV